MSAKLRPGQVKAALRRTEPLTALQVVDPRQQSAQILGQGDAQVLSAIEDTFTGMSLLKDRDKIEMLITASSEVRDQWVRVRDSFLTIGRKLLTIEERLTAEEFNVLRREHGRIFPFSDGVAFQLREVARAVRARRIGLEECPHGYSVAYQLAAMSDEQLQRAREAHLVRPDVTRAKVIAFRRSLAEEERKMGQDESPKSLAKMRLSELGDERRQLLERLCVIGRLRREAIAVLAAGGE